MPKVVNKVEYNGNTLIDLTEDTVTPQTLLQGATAHSASGQSISGSVDLSTKADKVANATSGNFAGLDASGNLTDSGKSAADFATASDMTTVKGVIPSTATTLNKLATASDVSAKEDAITQSATLTLTVNGWDSTLKTQTVTFAHDITKRNVIDITVSELETWAECGVLPTGETNAGITFKCEEIPESALTFKVTSMGVTT